MGLSPISYILIAVCAPVYLAVIIYIATQTFWKNSPFRSQSSYDKWFIGRMENISAVVYEDNDIEVDDDFTIDSSNTRENIYLEAINTGFSPHLPHSFEQGKPFGLM